MLPIKVYLYNLSPYALGNIEIFIQKHPKLIHAEVIQLADLAGLRSGFLFIEVHSKKDVQVMKKALKTYVSIIALVTNLNYLKEILSVDVKGMMIPPYNYADLSKMIKSLNKNIDPEEIESKIKAIPYYTKDHPKNPTAFENITKNLQLTVRELDLLYLLSCGYMYKEIADRKGITIGTVKQHLHKIYNKLGVNNKIEAINLIADTFTIWSQERS